MLFATILCRLGYLWAAGRFCRKYLEISEGKEKLWMALLLGSGMLSGVLRENFAALPDIFFILGQHVILIGSVMLLFQGGMERKFLTASILTAVTTLMGNFFTSLGACLLLVWKHTWHHIPVPFIEAGEENLLVCGVQIASMLAVCRLSGRRFSFFAGQEIPSLDRVREENRTNGLSSPVQSGSSLGLRKGYAVLAMPLLAVTLVVDVANWGASHGVMVRSGGNMGLYYDQIFSHTEFLILTALSMSAAGFYLFGLDRIYLEQRKSGQYHARIAAYQMLEEQYGQMERLRHDMKNHVIALTGLLEHRELEKLAEYLDRMRDSGGFGKAEEATGSRAVDALLYRKRQEAESRKIRWECDVRIPKSCRIDEFDLCILFGNILDNAVEACGRLAGDGAVDETGMERFIEIRAEAVKKCFLLEVKNSADPEEECRDGRSNRKDQGRQNGQPGQREKDPERHGIGLLNIKDMVTRYNGAMSTEFQDGVFSASVLVPLEEDSART